MPASRPSQARFARLRFPRRAAPRRPLKAGVEVVEKPSFREAVRARDSFAMMAFSELRFA
jgi:hypothetical protein